MLYGNYDKIQVAKRIQRKMAEAGVSDTEVADSCDVTKQAVSQWFKTGNISVERFPIIANLLNCSIDELLTGKVEASRAEQLAKNLQGVATTKSLTVLKRIQRAAAEGKLCEEDLVLLDAIAKRFENG